MAQQVEHVLGKDEVTGSSPVSSSRINIHLQNGVDIFYVKIYFILKTLIFIIYARKYIKRIAKTVNAILILKSYYAD